MTLEEEFHLHQSLLLQEDNIRLISLQWIEDHLEETLDHIETLTGGWPRMLERTRL